VKKQANTLNCPLPLPPYISKKMQKTIKFRFFVGGLYTMPFSYRNKFTMARNLVNYKKYEKMFPVLSYDNFMHAKQGKSEYKV